MRDWKPTEHIFVKDAQQFVDMLKRRGYEPVETTDKQGKVIYTVSCPGTWYAFSVESVLYHFVAEIAEWFDKWLAQGWKHMQCVQCGIPVLVRFKYVDEEQTALKWYGVCSVQTGPHSEHLQVCEGCGIEFGYPLPLREIDDISSTM